MERTDGIPTGKPPQPDHCQLCSRKRPLTFHHLIPKKTHKKRRIRTKYRRSELHTRGLWLCRLCHRQLHRFYSEDHLAMELNTREALVTDPKIARFLTWARKQKT